jgi:hypothetical protein
MRSQPRQASHLMQTTQTKQIDNAAETTHPRARARSHTAHIQPGQQRSTRRV